MIEEPDENSECFISVDVETSGPVPGLYSLLSIGACVVRLGPDKGEADEDRTFYCTLKPIVDAGSDPVALRISGLSLNDLEHSGSIPEDAMSRFGQWAVSVAGNAKPVFVGFNAGFDWSFVNYYFHKFVGSNPFGFAALDIKSLYMGWAGSSWQDTRSSKIHERFPDLPVGTHNALEDALAQSQLLQAMWLRR